MVLTYLCPWTLNLHIAIVLLCLRAHYLVEIKRYKSLIRIRITYKHFTEIGFLTMFFTIFIVFYLMQVIQVLSHEIYVCIV